jgi:pilus assembly protein Flp/PilA
MLTKLFSALRTLRHDDKGATAIEYGLIAALISLMLVAGAQVAGPALQTLFNTIGTTLTGAV